MKCLNPSRLGSCFVCGKLDAFFFGGGVSKDRCMSLVVYLNIFFIPSTVRSTYQSPTVLMRKKYVEISFKDVSV